MSGYSAEQIRGCRCSSRPQVILSVGECKIASERFHDSSALGTCIGLLTGQSVPIFIQAVGSFLISARILMSRFESLRSRLRALPFGRERRNISMTC